MALTSVASAEEFTSIIIPLRDGHFYSCRDFCRACNRQLGTIYQLDKITNRESELGPAERAALLLAHEAGLLRVQFERDRLVLSFPNSEDPITRQRNRRRLERVFAISIPTWPAGKGLHLPEHFDQDAKTVLLVHGLESGTADLARWREACEHWGLQVLLFDYPSDGPLARSGEQLAGELRQLATQYPRLRLAVIAHSMGGLVVRHCLEIPGKNPGCVTDVFTLGTPHAGSSLTSAHGWLELALQGMRVWPTAEVLQEGLGEAADDLAPHSRFLRGLDARRRPAGVRYHVAVGCKTFVPEVRRAAIEAEVATVLARRGTPPETRQTVLALLRCDEVRDGKGDGVVTVASAQLAGADTQAVFNLNHLELAHLPGERPEDCELFRWIMKTMNWQRLGVK